MFDIIERLLKGRQARVRRGLPPGGTVPYGYRRDGKVLAFDEQEAEVVRMSFELAERSTGASAIARELNGKDLLRRNGKPWTQRQVAAVLSRRARYAEGRVQYGEAFGENKSLVPF